uniref:Uncharacterized protein n=1 Tax=Ananas comosus var. bracteatus TaxID=296719 RepID=A0A6V7NZG9_ANACO|nr:unnamed protein product [Ananas comosus var. bracteatus]
MVFPLRRRVLGFFSPLSTRARVSHQSFPDSSVINICVRIIFKLLAPGDVLMSPFLALLLVVLAPNDVPMPLFIATLLMEISGFPILGSFIYLWFSRLIHHQYGCLHFLQNFNVDDHMMCRCFGFLCFCTFNIVSERCQGEFPILLISSFSCCFCNNIFLEHYFHVDSWIRVLHFLNSILYLMMCRHLDFLCSHNGSLWGGVSNLNQIQSLWIFLESDPIFMDFPYSSVAMWHAYLLQDRGAP